MSQPPNRATLSRWMARNSPTIGAFFFASLTIYGTAVAETQLYQETRILGLTNNQCQGAPHCTVVNSSVMKIEAGKSKAILVKCPTVVPYVWGWDTKQNEHIVAYLTKVSAGGVTVTAGNVANGPGMIEVFIGCSNVAWHGTSFPSSRIGLPSGVIRSLAGGQ